MSRNIDWANVPLDTLVWVRNPNSSEWKLRCLKEYSNGYFKCFPFGATSENTCFYADPTFFTEAMLADEIAPSNEEVLDAVNVLVRHTTLVTCDECFFNDKDNNCCILEKCFQEVKKAEFDTANKRRAIK